MTTEQATGCPVHGGRDDRKSASLAAANVRPQPGATVVRSFEQARAVLRSSAMRQAGAGFDEARNDLTQSSVFFLEGETHRRRRTAIARYFTPKVIATRHRAVMERTADELMAELRAAGGGALDAVSFRMTVAVAAEIVGLTDSDQQGMAKRIKRSLLGTRLGEYTGLRRTLVQGVVAAHAVNFLVRDVLPAVRARRTERREDVISHLLDEEYSIQQILVECMTYAVAGMVTTREFIVMAAWHLFDDDALRARFVAGDEADQLAVLEEILRIEPVAAMLHRKATEDVELPLGAASKGEVLALSIRDANVDEATVGDCPFALDPDRAERVRMVGAYMSFGDGSHRCPGAQVAMHESRVFLDRLFALPGLRLVQPPTMTWNDGIESYELREALVSCDP
ncbi:cytochrome P450 [Blastococcus sp. TF02A-26]|uniref:cytochrome P450 n=1 Tax=Blastococcus sp. TF02A-26 TaxID=2250577 RepID=UPI000DE9431F|nr:cytochrome P450 [Blastococcus sp. TF02A-26]RBY83306.1 cytochrome P450 [Blastococcus sp. TF02A-26]